MIRRQRNLILLTLLATLPVVIITVLLWVRQRPQQCSINGDAPAPVEYTEILARFAEAAGQQGRHDWPRPTRLGKEARPGTQVLVTVTDRRVDIVIAAAAIGKKPERIRREAERIADAFRANRQGSAYVFVTRLGEESVANLAFPDALPSGYRRRGFSWSLAPLLQALRTSSLLHPIIIAQDRRLYSRPPLPGDAPTPPASFRFRRLEAMKPDARLRLSAPWRYDDLFFALIGALFLVASSALWCQQNKNKDGTSPSPDEIQRRYDRQIPYPLFVLGMLCVVAGIVWWLPLDHGSPPVSVLITPLLLNFLFRQGRQTLTEGPLFEVTQDMAARAGVRVRCLLLLKSTVLNAFAFKTDRVAVTEGLVEHLEADEVKAVIAHEIGHLYAQHGRCHLLLSLGAGMALWAIWYGGIALVRRFLPDPLFAFLANPLLFVFPAMFLKMRLIGPVIRRHEFEADAFAARLVGDGDVLARALTKGDSINGFPARLKPFDELFSTHPSLVHRVETLRQLARSG